MARDTAEATAIVRRSPQRSVAASLTVSLVVVVSAVVGLVSAVALTVEKLQLIRNPGSALSCDVSVLVACGKGLESWQGSLLGFPNSIIGIAAWAALLVVGLTMLTRTAFAFPFWIGLNVGLLAGSAVVVFLIYQSIYVLGTLCPWCMATWVVMIPCVLAVSLFNLRHWSSSDRVRAAAGRTMQWLLVICVGCYVLVAVLAQLRLDVLGAL